MTIEDVEAIAERVALRLLADWPAGYLKHVADSVARDVPGVVRVRYSLQPDHDGRDTVFFRVVVADYYCPDGRISRDVLDPVRERISAIAPVAKVPCVVNWRSESEQRRLKCREWE